jgi:hypothetical protein
MEEYGYRQNSVDLNPYPVIMQVWLIIKLKLMIPIVNLVMPFVWAFGGGANPSKAIFFKAQLIFIVIGIILWLIFAGVLMGYFMNFRYIG